MSPKSSLWGWDLNFIQWNSVWSPLLCISLLKSPSRAFYDQVTVSLSSVENVLNGYFHWNSVNIIYGFHLQIWGCFHHRGKIRIWEGWRWRSPQLSPLQGNPAIRKTVESPHCHSRTDPLWPAEEPEKEGWALNLETAFKCIYRDYYFKQSQGRFCRGAVHSCLVTWADVHSDDNIACC